MKRSSIAGEVASIESPKSPKQAKMVPITILSPTKEGAPDAHASAKSPGKAKNAIDQLSAPSPCTARRAARDASPAEPAPPPADPAPVPPPSAPRPSRVGALGEPGAAAVGPDAPQEAAAPEPPKPSAREVREAEAARARLYGAGPAAAAEAPVSASLKLPSGDEPRADIEVSYPSRAELAPLAPEEARGATGRALAGAASKDWVETCEALTLLRRLAAHHPALLLPSLAPAARAVLGAVRNLRSAVAKTGLLAAADLVESYKESMAPLLDQGGVDTPATSLLHQILIKAASNDKKFVVEAAEAALSALASSSPALLRNLAAPYCARHKNPKVRGKAAPLLAAGVRGSEPGEMLSSAASFDSLLRTAASLVKDNTPEAREGGRAAIEALRRALLTSVGQGDAGGAGPGDAGGPGGSRGQDVWEARCVAVLGAAAAAQLLKSTAGGQ